MSKIDMTTLLTPTNEKDLTAFELASAQGDNNMLEILFDLAIKEGISWKEILTAKTKYGSILLHVASSHKHTLEYLLEKFFEAGISTEDALYRKNNAGSNLLQLLIRRGDIETFDFIVELARRKEINVQTLLDTRTDIGFSLVHLSSSDGRNDTLGYLLDLIKKEGKDEIDLLNETTENGHNSLHLIATSGHASTMRFLFKRLKRKRANLLQMIFDLNENERNIFHLASWRGYLDVVKEIMNQSKFVGFDIGKEIKKCTKDEENVLYLSSSTGNVNTLKCLVEYCDLNQVNAVELLLSRNKYGYNSLESSIGILDTFSFIWTYIQNKNKCHTDILREERDGRINILSLIVKRGCVSTLNFVLDFYKNKNINIIDTLIQNDIFHISIENDNFEIFLSIWDYAEKIGVHLKDVLIKEDKDSYTFLHLAASRTRIDVIEYVLKYFIEKKIDISMALLRKNRFDKNILHISVDSGNLEIFSHVWTHLKEHKEIDQVEMLDLMELLTLKGHLKELKSIIDYFEKNENMSKSIMKYRNSKNESLLHVSILSGDINMFNCVLKLAQDARFNIGEVLQEKTNYGFSICQLIVIKRQVVMFTNLVEVLKSKEIPYNHFLFDRVNCDFKGSVEGDIKEIYTVYKQLGFITVLDLIFFNRDQEMLRYIFDLLDGKKLHIFRLLELKIKNRKNVFFSLVQFGNPEMLKLTFEYCKRNNIDLSTLFKNTSEPNDNLLHFAFNSGHKDIVNYLLNYCQINGLNINYIYVQKDKNGFTAFHRSLKENNRDIAMLIINSYRNSQNSKDLLRQKYDLGQNILHLLFTGGSTGMIFDILNLFEKFKMEIADFLNDKNKNGENPLHCAVYNDNLEVFENFVKYSRSERINVESYLVQKLLNADTIFHSLVKVGNMKCFEYVIDFLSADASSNVIDLLSAKNKFGESVLHFTAKYGRLDMLKYLIDFYKGKEIDVENLLKMQDLSGRDVLQVSLKNCKGLETSKYLVEIIQDKDLK